MKGIGVMKKVFNNQSGFTLVEIICAIALLGIIAVPTYNVFIGAANGQSKSELQLQANNTAQALLEDILKEDTITVGETTYEHEGFLANVNIEKSTELENSLNNNGDNSLSFNSGKTPVPSDPSDDPVVNEGEPEDYNARIEIFDYADRDFYFMMRGSLALLLKDSIDIDEYLSSYTAAAEYPDGEADYFKTSVLRKHKDIQDFSETEKKELMERANLTLAEYNRLYACYAGLPQSEVIEFTKFMLSRYTLIYEKTKSCFAGGDDTSASEKIDYILNSYNIFDTISDIYETLYNGSDKEKEFFEGLHPSWYETNLKSYMVSNLYNTMYTTTMNATTNGPILRLKLFDVSKNIVKLGGKWVLTWYPTTGGSYGADINFQIYQDRIGFENWGLSYTWSESYNPLNIETTNLPQKGWGAGNPGYTNIYSDMTFYITGTLQYRTVRFGITAGSAYATKSYDEETDTWTDYTANMNFFETVSCGENMFNVEKYGDYSWLHFNDSASKKKTPSSGFDDESTKVTYKWGDEDDKVYKITLTLFKLKDKDKKRPIVTLTAFRNTTTGANVEKVTTTASPTPEKKDDTPKEDEPYTMPTYKCDVTGNINVNFGETEMTVSDDSGNVIASSAIGKGNISISPTDFSFKFAKNFGTTEAKSKFPVEYKDDGKQIDKLIWVFDGTSQPSSSFEITINGDDSYVDLGDSERTEFIIYNYSDVKISIKDIDDASWLKNNGVTVIDRNGNETILTDKGDSTK